LRTVSSAAVSASRKPLPRSEINRFTMGGTADSNRAASSGSVNTADDDADAPEGVSIVRIAPKESPPWKTLSGPMYWIAASFNSTRPSRELQPT
jgi:hypothetical protein